jgi:hypothetical protein
MDAVQRLLLLVAQRRGVLSVDMGFASDVVMTFKRDDEDQRTVCEPDVEAAADRLASEITGSGRASGRRP